MRDTNARYESIKRSLISYLGFGADITVKNFASGRVLVWTSAPSDFDGVTCIWSLTIDYTDGVGFSGLIQCHDLDGKPYALFARHHLSLVEDFNKFMHNSTTIINSRGTMGCFEGSR